MSANVGPLRISLFGNFGSGNFGNECTLHAMLCNVRKYIPRAEISCICTCPRETASNYNIATFEIKEVLRGGRTERHGPAMKWLRRLVLAAPMELYRCARAVAILRNIDVLVMTGTGMLGDFGIGPFGLHYDILRWSILAKLCRCKLLFVSVGAGPIQNRLSKWFVKAALRLADYRSYRDNFSKDYLESIGFKDERDAVYPDLAFSLPPALLPDDHSPTKPRPIVGVGVMTYYDKRSTAEHGDAIYREYVEKLAAFVGWLIEREYTVRLLFGDAIYDTQVMTDLQTLLKQRGVPGSAVLAQPIAGPSEVLSQLAATDFVVASRFHNVLLALMLNKPVVSISYHDKVDALMAGFGLATFCQDIERFDLETLIAQLMMLEQDATSLKPRIQRTAEAYRDALDNQYERIVNIVAA